MSVRLVPAPVRQHQGHHLLPGVLDTSHYDEDDQVKREEEIITGLHLAETAELVVVGEGADGLDQDLALLWHLLGLAGEEEAAGAGDVSMKLLRERHDSR